MHKLEVGKWILIWVCIAEAISIAVASAMYLMGQVEGRYDNLNADEAQNLATVELNSIKTSMATKSQDKGSNRFVSGYTAESTCIICCL